MLLINLILVLILMQDGDANEVQKKVVYSFRMMSRCFSDPAKAEENFQILDQLKDANVWKILKILLDPTTTTSQASNSRVRKKIQVRFVSWPISLQISPVFGYFKVNINNFM